MVNAHVYKKGNEGVEGYFDTTGRLWGGPDVVRIYFAVTFDTPFRSLDGWVGSEQFKDISDFMAMDHRAFWQLAARTDSICL